MTEQEIRACLSKRDCLELKRLILENPEAPLIVLTNEDSWSGEYNTEMVKCSATLEEVTVFNNNLVDNEEDLLEDIANHLSEEEEYERLDEARLENLVLEESKNYPFVKAIMVRAF